MEEDQEQRHVCKLCSKSFPCGRSLGGHMRSHVIMNSAETDEKLCRKKLSSLNNGGGGGGGGGGGSNTTDAGGFDHAGAPAVYGLRENPKKTCRFADSSEDTLLHGKFCKDCGKVFQSWKALFGHMKCHSAEREKVSNSFEEENSWTNANQKLVMDSQSDNEAAAPNRRRRSRRRTRYMAAAAATSSSFSIANNASSSVSEIEQEQEEVAMCLIMLSKDMGQWGGLNSAAESSDNNDSVFLEAPSSSRANQIKDKSTAACNGGDTVKLKKLMKDEKFESGSLDSESFQFMRNGSKMKKLEVSINGFLGNDKIKNSKLKDGLRLIEVSEVELGKNLIKETATDQAHQGQGQGQAQLGSKKHNSIKKKQLFIDSFNPELVVDSSKKKKKKKIADQDASDSETCKSSHKRSKFECTTCNKIFHSYQALGGHRASHKKIKGCFASKVESSENSIETELSPDPTATTTTDSKLIKSCTNKSVIEHDAPSGYPEKPETVLNKSKKIFSKGHECPICFKVFSSGQALGGHKRSHLLGASETNKTNNNQTIVTQKPVAEIRDLLDLNLPAPIEEESNNAHIGFKPWWAGSSHKHEPLVGLISN